MCLISCRGCCFFLCVCDFMPYCVFALTNLFGSHLYRISVLIDFL